MLKAIRSRLWVRLAAVFVLASVVPILGAGILTANILEEAVRRDAARRQQTLARLSGALVRQYIDVAKQKLTTVGRLLAKDLYKQNVGEYTEGNTAYRQTVLRNLNGLVEPPDVYNELEYYAAGNQGAGAEAEGATEQSLTQNVFVARAQQTKVSNSQYANLNLEELQQEQVRTNAVNPPVQRPLTTNRPWNDSQVADNWGFQTLTISAPVTQGKEPLGAVVAYLDFDRVNLLLGNVAQAGYHVRLSDGTGKMLAQAGCFEEQAVSETLPAGFSDWVVEVREPALRVYGAMDDVRRQVYVWIGLAVFLAVGFGIGISAWIVRPVTALTETARKMESGDLAARSRVDRDDEIGRLGAAFDRMAASLQQLDEAKSGFVANVSHEMRTPLTSVKVSIANLLDGVAGPLEERQRETLHRLRGDVDRMIALVNDLLELARLEAGAVRLRREPCDLAFIARECAGAIEPLARQKNISVTAEGEGRADADPSMIRRVVANLVENAVKFTPDGGKVRIAVQDREIRVSDTGPGVEDERVFEKFAQGRQEGIKSRGAGLGLAIAKKVVDLHGGSIEVKSDQGSIFTVRL